MLICLQHLHWHYNFTCPLLRRPHKFSTCLLLISPKTSLCSRKHHNRSKMECEHFWHLSQRSEKEWHWHLQIVASVANFSASTLKYELKKHVLTKTTTKPVSYSQVQQSSITFIQLKAPNMSSSIIIEIGQICKFYALQTVRKFAMTKLTVHAIIKWQDSQKFHYVKWHAVFLFQQTHGIPMVMVLELPQRALNRHSEVVTLKLKHNRVEKDYRYLETYTTPVYGNCSQEYRR